MRVVYKKPIVDKLYQAVHKARLKNKDIDYIEVTKEEMKELRMAIPVFYGPPSIKQDYLEFYGCKVYVEGWDEE